MYKAKFKSGQKELFPTIITEIKRYRYCLTRFLKLFLGMYFLELGVFVYKCSTTDLPVAFRDYFRKLSNIHDYPTRHVNDLNLTNNKESFSDHSTRTCGPILWNSLPTAKFINHLRNQFKLKLIHTYV